MSDNIVTWNVENWVTITLMTLIGFTVANMALKAMNKTGAE
jgi:hypothetical protein